MMIKRILENKWAMFFCIALIYFARNYFRFFDNALWGEDGPIFLATSYQAHLKWSSLLIPYAGYLHFAIRIIALICNMLPLYFIPTGYHICAYLMVLYVVYITINSRINLAQRHKNLLGLALVTISSIKSNSIASEIFIILTNIQWFTCFIMITHILENYGEDRRFLPIVHALIFGLQGPFSILLAPFALLKGIITKERNTSYWGFTGIIIITGIVQYTFSRRRVPHNINIKLTLWIHQIFTLFFHYLGAFCIFYLILVILVIRILYIRKFKIHLFYFAFCNVFALLAVFSGLILMGTVFTPEMMGRYFFIPYTLFTWSLIYIMGMSDFKKKYRNCAKILWLIILFYMIKYFFVFGHDNYDWSKQVTNYSKDHGSQFIVAPGGSWRFSLEE